MVEDETRPVNEGLLVLPLAISKGITNIPTLVVSILMIEIGVSYNVTPGVTGQLNTVASLLAIVFALIMGLLSIRYDHRNLLVLGLLLYAFSTASCVLAGSFYVLLPLFALTGIAYAMVNPMVSSLIGAHVPAEKRTGAIGYTVGGLAFIYLLASLSTAYLSKILGWQMTLVVVVVPISVLAVALVLFIIPSTSRQVRGFSALDLLTGYRGSLGNRSVLACLLSTAIGMSTWYLFLIYHATFLRQTFGVSATSVSQIVVLFSLSYISGSLVTGWLARKFSRKVLAVGMMSFLSFFSVFAMIVSSIFLAVGIGILASLSTGIWVTIMTSLTLDQVPKFRGTVMSLQSAAFSVGSMASAIVGGVIITYFGFGPYGIVMGLAGFFGVIVLYFFSKDPTAQ